MKISVIVPIYNAESTLCRCLDSLRFQSFEDFEVLMIDDGSPDNSGEIMDKYAHCDARFKAFHKKNGGVSSARQFGINHALGEYSIHVDPDDWVEPKMLEDLYDVAIRDKADMVICDYFEDGRYNSKLQKQNPESTFHLEVLKALFLDLHGSCWNKLIRTDSYRKYNVSFPLELCYCEDQYVCASLLKHNLKIAYLPKAYYHYINLLDKNTLSRSYNESSIEKDFKAIALFDSLLKDSEAYHMAMKCKKVQMVCRAFRFGCCCFSDNEFKKLFNRYSKLFLQGGGYSYERPFIFLACCGYYHISYRVFQALLKTWFVLKRLLK